MNSETNQSTGGNFAVSRALVTQLRLTADRAQALRQTLAALDGVLEVKLRAGSRRAHIRYDASRTGFPGIAAAFSDSGCPLAADRWSRLKWSWFGYLDTNAKTNAGTLGGSCCSRPTDVYASRGHKR